VPTNPQPVALGAGLRWARALAVAATAWSTASAAHLLGGGGHLPPLAVMSAMIVITAWPMTLSLAGQASGRRLICLVGAGQALMHLAFVVLAAWSAPGAASASVASTMPAMGAHHANLPALMPISGGGSAGVSSAGHTMSIAPSPLMLLAHLTAAVLLGCALRSGERALFSLLGHLAQLARPAVRVCRQVQRVLATLLAGPDLAPATVVEPSWDQIGPRLPEHLLVRAVGWRGPPRELLSFA
jgi:hypothetical protein